MIQDESKRRVVPYLYKYRALDTDMRRGFVDRILNHSELYFARPHEFNDPFDCYPVPKKLSKSEVDRYLRDLWRRRRPGQARHERRAELKTARLNLGDFADRQREMIDQTVNECGVLSLSAKPDDVLMWSHYALSHSGICLRFRVALDPPFFAVALPVHYQDERPVVDLSDMEARQSGELVDKVLLTKATYWSYEDEFRLIEHRAPGVVKFPPRLLEGVILGAKISDENKALVERWIKERGFRTEILQARFHDDLFKLEIDHVSWEN